MLIGVQVGGAWHYNFRQHAWSQWANQIEADDVSTNQIGPCDPDG